MSGVSAPRPGYRSFSVGAPDIEAELHDRERTQRRRSRRVVEPLVECGRTGSAAGGGLGRSVPPRPSTSTRTVVVTPPAFAGQVARAGRRRPDMPPSTARDVPVTAPAIGDARYTTASATSCAVTRRPVGWRAAS